MRLTCLSRLSSLVPVFLLLWVAPAAATSPGATLRETPLQQKPFSDAAVVATLPAKTDLEVLGRQGGWLKVLAKGKEGLVRMLHVRASVATGQASVGTQVQGVATLATGRAGKGNIVATSGIRGLSDEELKAAKPNPTEFKKLDGFAVSDEEAKQYAARVKAEAREVPYLPPPAEPDRGPPGGATREDQP
ncbi:MAG: SH3 domain-containing protein [Deltaproteobacteria bacterium]|nr:SH3 domain-containing protein [Deltaproteobacteria bacterium]